MAKMKLNTESYKGTRDFYPEDLAEEKYLFDKMRETAESFGYVEYQTPLLEEAALFKAKTGEEIVEEQTYTFLDRGQREVTLRPEITPSLARLVARKRQELSYPLRWYSIANLFRYERPQKGRLREHFQLNVDILGAASQEAEAEIVSVAYNLMLNLDAKPSDFEIRINNRKISEALYNRLSLSAEQRRKVSKIIDKRGKISEQSFKEALDLTIGEKSQELLSILDSNTKLVKMLGEKSQEITELTDFIESLDKRGIKNVRFNQNLVRGFDYYTSFVFEIYDSNPQNKRSLFGGGRYDELLEIFGQEKLPAVGFGAGDVTILDFLRDRKLIPAFESPVRVYLCRLDKKFGEEINTLAYKLRAQKVNVAVDLTDRKVGDQIKTADKQKIPFIICVGEDEIKSKKYKVKRLSDGREFTLEEEKLVSFLKESR